MRWILAFCIGAAALVSACGVGARYPDFSAKQYHLAGNRTLPGTDISGPAAFYLDNEHMRYEGLLENHGVATVVYDPARHTAYMLNSSRTPRPQFAGVPPPRVATPLSEGETPQPFEVAWETLGPRGVKAFGPCRIAGESGTLWRPREPIAPGIIRTACITPDGIVLQLTENDKVLFEATSVTRGPQPASLFAIPETYQILNNAELAEAEEQQPVQAAVVPPGG